MTARRTIATAAIWGALGFALGAFGAHGLPSFLTEAGFSPEAVATRLTTFETAARYHLYGALALLALGVAQRQQASRAWTVAGWLLLAGTLLFSGSLYGLALTEGWKWLGPVTPLGGLLTIAGWIAIAVGALATNAKAR